LVSATDPPAVNSVFLTGFKIRSVKEIARRRTYACSKHEVSYIKYAFIAFDYPTKNKWNLNLKRAYSTRDCWPILFGGGN
jgi:hypothetical protein